MLVVEVRRNGLNLSHKKSNFKTKFIGFTFIQIEGQENESRYVR